ncbi:RWD domain-containing protein 1 [Diaphorina citri]|uniref:RWD domain-containing protein 1 n=2 Tax=Diaphorina citri TaxID=121845 RepID=A0A1S4ERP2_DIACI|nr:RWD domain-containing protein 1 [Diaphorina citri]KAI5697595.1 hypothetical protein M8J75_012889 [Diaphorina citri]KAI5719560.1 hypothetical protein M8J76_011900 [Diaphorina citri]KAI5721317.1 hypothetical protein M8J77_019079 [Diaphorina citri]
MDYQEEQSNEIEALDSIYYGDMEILEKDPHVFTIPIQSECVDDEHQMNCLLRFQYTPKYPEEIPIIEIENCDNIDEDVERELKEYLLTQANENLGMVMIFTLVSSAQEWLSTKSDQLKKDKEEAEEKRIKAEEAAEQKRFEGTVVTLETFIAWKAKFDKDMAHIIFEEKNKAKEKTAGKLTGREMFMQDKSMNESDLKFIEESGDGGLDATESVEVNETLFQDMNDLDLSDSDDPDYDPNDDD